MRRMLLLSQEKAADCLLRLISFLKHVSNLCKLTVTLSWMKPVVEINLTVVDGVITFVDFPQMLRHYVQEWGSVQYMLNQRHAKVRTGYERLWKNVPSATLASAAILAVSWKDDDLSLPYIHTVAYVSAQICIFTPSVLQICSDISHEASLPSIPLHISSLWVQCLTDI